MHVPARTCTDLRAHMHLHIPAHTHVHTQSRGHAGYLHLLAASALDFSGSWFCLSVSFSSSFPSPPAPSALRTPLSPHLLTARSGGELIVSGDCLPRCRQDWGAESLWVPRPQVRAAVTEHRAEEVQVSVLPGTSACSLRAHGTLVLQPGPPWPGSTDTERRREGGRREKEKGKDGAGERPVPAGAASGGGSGASRCRFQPRLPGDGRSPPGCGPPRSPPRLTASPVPPQGNFVACMTAILRQMEDYHYAHLITTFGKMRTDVVVSVAVTLSVPCRGQRSGQTLVSSL